MQRSTCTSCAPWRGWAALLLLAGSARSAQVAPTVRVSQSASGVQASGSSQAPAMTPDGVRVTFYSTATNLVTGDTNTSSDVFLKNLSSQAITRVSVNSTGAQATGPSGWNGTQIVPASISSDGLVVAFCSTATNLVGGDTNGASDVFVRDLSASSTTRVSISSAGVQAMGQARWCALSADGMFVTFSSTANNLVGGDLAHEDVFLHSRANQITVLISQNTAGQKGIGDSGLPSVSGDGMRVAFQSLAGNFDALDGNADLDVFVRDLATLTTTRISAGPGGSVAFGGSFKPAISADGNFVAYASTATNLVSGDTNGFADIFVHDLQTSSTSLVSKSTAGVQANALCTQPYLSADGRYCAFESLADNLVAGDANGQNDVFVHDLLLGTTTRANLTFDSLQSVGPSYRPVVSADGRYVAFDSPAPDLVASDSNSASDVFRRDRLGAPPVAYCVSKLNSQGCFPSIQFLGIPSATLGAGFTVYATNEINQQFGVLFYSLTGPASNPFQGGTMCCLQPIVRTQIQNSGGNPPPNDCSGTYSLDFNTYIASGVNPALSIGVTVWSQYWGRDAQSPSTTSLSDALKFTIGD